MAKYTEVEKSEILRKFYLLKQEGGVEINGETIINVREFCKEVGISSYTLYQWNAKFVVKEEREESENLLGELSDLKDDLDNFVGTSVVKKEVKRIDFGIDFWMHVARNMGIKNYRMNLNQLKLRIGNELIKSTGLISNGVRKELKL